VHVAHVLERLRHGDPYPSAVRRCRQPPDQRHAPLVTFHESNDFTALEMAIIALRLEVAGAAVVAGGHNSQAPQRDAVLLTFADRNEVAGDYLRQLERNPPQVT